MYFQIFLVLLWATYVHSIELPPFTKRCALKDANFDECFVKGIETAFRNLKSGSNVLNLPSLDPISIPKLTIGAKDGPVNVEQKLENVLLYGYSDAEVKKIEGSLEEKQFIMHLLLPNMTMEADYDLNGNILSLPIQGKGHLVFYMTNVYVAHTLEVEKVAKKGENHFKIVAYSIDLKPERVQYSLDNLFNGNEQLRDVTVKAMNDNWEVVFADAKKSYEEAYSIVFKDYVNRIFGKVPARNMFIY